MVVKCFLFYEIYKGKVKKKDFQNKLHISSESFPPEIQNNKHIMTFENFFFKCFSFINHVSGGLKIIEI